MYKVIYDTDNDGIVNNAELWNSYASPATSGSSGQYLQTWGEGSTDWVTIDLTNYANVSGSNVDLFHVSGLTDNTVSITPQQIRDAYDVSVEENIVIDGCNTIWTGTGLTYSVSPGSYYIKGVRYTTTGGSVTLDAADPTNARIDVIVVDTSGSVDKVTGTAAASPSEPAIDNESQLKRTIVTLAAGATTPAVTTTAVYTDNTEWTATSSNAGRINPDSTNDPRSGTKSVEFASPQVNDNIVFDKGSSLDFTNVNVLNFYVKSKASWGATAYLEFQMLTSTGAARGSTIVLGRNRHGFIDTNTADFQQITVNFSNFQLRSTDVVQKLRIRVRGGTFTGCYLDDISFQQGVPPTSVQSVIQTIETDNGYFTATGPSDRVRVIGGSGIVTSTSGNVITITNPVDEWGAFTPPNGNGSSGTYLKSLGDGTTAWATPSGDMTQAVYDTNADGIVNTASSGELWGYGLYAFSTPAGYGTSGQVLQTNANGSTAWVTTSDGTTDHGALSGLTDDDHTQYALADGSRGFSNAVSGVDPTNSYELATKNYVDSLGSGDMFKSVYDSDNDGYVELADAALTWGSGDIAFSRPNVLGTSGTYLRSHGDGTTSWFTPSGDGSGDMMQAVYDADGDGFVDGADFAVQWGTGVFLLNAPVGYGSSGQFLQSVGNSGTAWTDSTYMLKATYDPNDDGVVDAAGSGGLWGTGLYAYSHPGAYGTSGHVLQTNANGTTAWVLRSSGDMLKGVYDTNNDGVVDYAVTWGTAATGLTMPMGYGTSGQVLQTNANGSTAWVTSSEGTSDHGALSGLADDDHSQYVLADGSRGFTNAVSGVSPSESYQLATKGYVDGFGSGDMFKSVYDADDDGVVDYAQSWGPSSGESFTAPAVVGTSGDSLISDGAYGTNWTSRYKRSDFADQTSVAVTHSFGVLPIVQVVDVSSGVIIPLSILHDSLNQFTVSFTNQTTGSIIAVR
jgi:hypothetical protein